MSSAPEAPRAAVFGCAGPRLREEERAFFRQADPWGFILFARNIEEPEQVRALVAEMRGAVGREAPILIDQEGGRVARLGPPHWPKYPPARAIGEIWSRSPEHAREAAGLQAHLMARDLAKLGINIDCAPVIDVPAPGGHAIIGDRAFAAEPRIVSVLGRAFCEGLLWGGVVPVVKHMPGHGRAGADSHLALPAVDTDLELLDSTDFVPFRDLADMPIAMTAHVAFTAIDGHRPATWSAKIIGEVVRARIGFSGVLLSDDLGMRALQGEFRLRTERALAAGCDIVLHCSGDMAEMEQVAEACTRLQGLSAQRCAKALEGRHPADAFDVAAAEARLRFLLAG